MSERSAQPSFVEVEGKPPARWRVFLVTIVFACCFALVAFVFWREDLRYSQPTPRPVDLPEVPLGTAVPLSTWLSSAGLSEAPATRPVLLHFFNPECSCSRFNLDHLHDLQRQFADRVTFVAVVQSRDSSANERATRERVDELGLGMPYLIDHGGRVAQQAGIYSTPQALVLDEGAHLVYRGNYNTSRYCTDPRTEFVRIALESQLSKRSIAVGETLSYGCELPQRDGQRAVGLAAEASGVAGMQELVQAAP